MSDTKLSGFYFPWPDLGVKLSRQWEKLRDNTEKEAPLIRAAYVDAQPSSANDPGNHDLSGWALGERDFRNKFRIYYDKNADRFSIQYNSGTEDVEVWNDYLSIRQVDGRVTVHGYGGLDSTVGGFYTPLARNLAVSATFTPANAEWVWNHSLNTKPILWNTFNLEDKSITPQSVDVSNPNVAYFYFAQPYEGRAIAVAEVARGDGIRVTDGTNNFIQSTILSFNGSQFYISHGLESYPTINLQPNAASGLDHGSLAGLSDDDHSQYLLASQATDRSTFTANWADLTDGGATTLHTHAGSSDHGTLTGLTDDDHSQYLLASDATNRATFAANWTDLTDGGATTLHSHAVADHGALTGLSDDDHPQYLLKTEAGPGFYGVVWSDGTVTKRTDRLSVSNADFYLNGSNPTLNLKDVVRTSGDQRIDGTLEVIDSPTESGSVTKIVNGAARTHRVFIHQNNDYGLGSDNHSDTNSAPPGYRGYRSRGTPEAPTIVADNDILNGVFAYGYDGTDYVPAARIRLLVDGTPGSNDMPGSIQFQTTPDGATTPVTVAEFTAAAALDMQGTSRITNLPAPQAATDAARLADVGSGFYGVIFGESDGDPTFRNDTIYFNSADFYLTPNSVGKPILNFRGSSGGGAGVSDHGALTGLSDDDHSQYLLASDATNRATFAANWTDLTDGGATTLHTHAGLAATVVVEESDGNPPAITTDTIIFNSSAFYITTDSAGDAVINIRPSGILTDGVLTPPMLSDQLKNVTSDLALGSTLNSTTVTVTSDGATVTLTWSSTDAAPIDVWFSTGIVEVAASGSVAATLTAGTNASPTTNYAYVLAASPTVLTVSTTGFPADSVEHCRVGTFIVQSASGVQTDGVYKEHAWTDHTARNNGTGHVAHVNAWVRTQPATWQSGVALTATINSAPAPDTVTLAVSSGSILQLHPHTFPAFADGSAFFVVNHPTAAYTKVTTMPGLTASGVAIGNNDRINVVVWGAIAENSGNCKLFMNLPTGYYTTNASAIADSNKYTNYTIPSDFVGVGFLIAKLTYQYTSTGGGTYTLVDNVDLRGLFPSIAAGGATAAASEFVDSAFRIYDNADSTKNIAFEASGITTGTTRTLTVQDRDGTIAFTDQLNSFYYLAVDETDGNPGPYATRALIFHSNDFYIAPNSIGQPIVNLRGSSGSGTALTVRDIDGNPTVSNVSTLQFTNGSVTDQGGGVAEVTLSAGGGISTLTIDAQSFGSQTTLGFNAQDFYLSGGATSKVLNLRYSEDNIPIFQELVTVSNYAVDTFAPYPYTINTVDIDCKSGSCVAAFYILSSGARNSNGISVGGLDPIDVSSTAVRVTATGNNTVNTGDCLMLSIPSNTTAKHLRISINARRPA